MTKPTNKIAYHHGDLRAALLRAGFELLESGEPFSLRAVARQAGVSTAAPYRHFADREELESALAVQGMQDLLAALQTSAGADGTGGGGAEFAVAYVRFAMSRPALFQLMFGRPCNDQDDERVRAASALHEYLDTAIAEALPTSAPAGAATAGWALAHGLAFLHLDGKLPNADPAEIDGRVRETFRAAFPAGHADRAVGTQTKSNTKDLSA